MTDDEKKAMQYFYNLRATIDESNMLFDEDIDVKCGKETIKQITIIFNLIEKQSKEIEELKEKNRQGKMRIVQLENEITARIEDVNQYYTPNDKIKAKIEELDKEEKEKLKGTKRQDRYAIKQEYMYKRSVLQSLL